MDTLKYTSQTIATCKHNVYRSARDMATQMRKFVACKTLPDLPDPSTKATERIQGRIERLRKRHQGVEAFKASFEEPTRLPRLSDYDAMLSEMHAPVMQGLARKQRCTYSKIHA